MKKNLNLYEKVTVSTVKEAIVKFANENPKKFNEIINPKPKPKT